MRLFALLLALLLLLPGGGCRPTVRNNTFYIQTAVPEEQEAFSAALFQTVGVPTQGGHVLTVLDNGTVFDAIEAEIKQAQKHIHILMYIWDEGKASDRLTTAIAERVKAGVKCRVLVDAVGSAKFEEKAGKALKKAGCDVRVFRPLIGDQRKLDRNHRKIVVVDGRVGFTGGLGISDDWLGDGKTNGAWRETNIRFSGPAVASAQQAFGENWLEAGGDFLGPDVFWEDATAVPAGTVEAAFVSSTASPAGTRAERLMHLVIGSAKKRLWIANAYVSPPPSITKLLAKKAEEGVDVRLLTAGRKSDSKLSFGSQQVHYQGLVAGGVKVWEYQPSMMHAKAIIVDDHLGLVGSINLEPLSLNKLEEDALIFIDPQSVAAMARAFEEDCKLSKEKF